MNNMLRTLSSPPPTISTQQAEQVALEAYGLAGTAELLGGERDRNFLLRTEGKDVLLKVANPAESDQLLEFQCAALRHVAAQAPDLPVPPLINAQDGRDWVVVSAVDGASYRVRVFGYLPGATLKDAPDDPRLMRNLGNILARLGQALRGFFHPGADHLLAWDLKRMDRLSDLAANINDPTEVDLVERVLDRFQRFVKPRLAGLRAQVIHNDVSFHNTVVDPLAPFEVVGIFDFGDLIHAPLIQDLAVTAAEVPAARVDPLSRCAEIVAGFHEISPLEDAEFELLPDMIAARLALGILVDTWAQQNITW